MAAAPVLSRATRPESLTETRRAGATINRYFHWLHAALEAVKTTQRQLFDSWVWESESKGRTRHLSLAEEAALAAALGPYASWMRLAILTGLRQAEQFTMQWTDVDLDRRLVTLPQTKAGPVQYIHLSDEAVAILRSFDSWQRCKWVFPSENPACPLDARNFYNRIWTPAVARAGIERARWHDLRHRGASRLTESGANASTIADSLRHASLMLVRRYGHLSQPHLQAAAELVSHFGRSRDDKSEETGKKPETRGLRGERTRTPKSQKVRVSPGELTGAGDPD